MRAARDSWPLITESLVGGVMSVSAAADAAEDLR
jgi:hypothetical protein